MKTTMTILVTMVMAAALVFGGSAATFAAPGMEGAICMANCTANPGATVGASETASAGTDYSCVSSPAYTGYVNVHPVPCDVNSRPLQTPWVMGAVQ